MTGGVMFGPENDLALLSKFDLETELEEPEARRDLLAMYYFVTRLLFTAVNSEWTLQGCSFSQRGHLVLLVVKATHEETPYVAYVTEQSTTRCIRIFSRLWLEGRVKWHPDKFR
jgi:hypothetical protein